jgi:hypothetical protein
LHKNFYCAHYSTIKLCSGLVNLMDVDKAMKSTDESKAAELGPSEHMVINPELAIGIIGCNVELEDIEPNVEPVDDEGGC